MNSRGIVFLNSLCMKNNLIQNAKRNNILLRNKPAIRKIQVRGCLNEKNAEIKPEFNMVYKLKEITLIASINGSKKTQYLVTMISIPSSAILKCLDIISMDTACAIGITTIIFSGLVTVVSKLLANTIGMLYVSNNMETIKISTVDSWGARKDLIVPATDWIYLSEIPQGRMSEYYVNARRYSTTETYRLFRSKGVIIDPKKMTAVFGDL